MTKFVVRYLIEYSVKVEANTEKEAEMKVREMVDKAIEFPSAGLTWAVLGMEAKREEMPQPSCPKCGGRSVKAHYNEKGWEMCCSCGHKWGKRRA